MYTQQKIKLVLPTPQEMNHIDQLVAKKISISQLMDNAGWIVYHEIKKRYHPCKITFLCGPGNNGGDGYVAAYLLAKEGWPVRVSAYAMPLLGKAVFEKFSFWEDKLSPFNIETVQDAEIVVDALFGAGLNRSLDASIVEILKCAKHIIAIDMPSGIDGKTGEVLGYAPQATLTITFCRAKRGHYLLPGRQYNHELVVADIGIDDFIVSQQDIQCWLNMPGLWCLPESAEDEYKYSRGIVNVIGGASMTGAARLSALAATKNGAGLVHVFALGNPDVYEVFSPCFMVKEANQKLFDYTLQNNHRNVWVCGPGLLSEEAKDILPHLITTQEVIIADAGSLQRDMLDLLKNVAVITPHIGEFTRVFGKIKGDRIQAVRDAAKQINAVVVLKGPDTIIAAPDGRVAINNHANERLATAGSGDVLTGIIAAFIANGMPHWEAVCASVWLHGQAALLHSNSWPTAEDIANNIGNARETMKIENIKKNY